MLSYTNLGHPAAWLQEVLDESPQPSRLSVLTVWVVGLARQQNVDFDANILISKLQ